MFKIKFTNFFSKISIHNSPNKNHFIILTIKEHITFAMHLYTITVL